MFFKVINSLAWFTDLVIGNITCANTKQTQWLVIIENLGICVTQNIADFTSNHPSNEIAQQKLRDK